MKAEEESDLAEEVAQHLEDRFRELRSGGASEEDAYRQAMHELDDLYPLRASLETSQRMPKREAARAGEAANGALLESIWKDIGYAFRSMRRSPGFVLVVVMTLALGIGANTTVFTVINTLILNPLPVRNTSELAAVTGEDARNTSRSEAVFPISYADLDDYRARNQVFRSLAGFTSARGLTLEERGMAQGIFGEFVTANYFSTLGLTPARGRFFSSEEGSVAAAHPVAVLNYAAWQTRFGGTPDILGRELQVNNVIVTVVGVAPPHFIGVNAIFGPDLWLPVSMAERMFPTSMKNLLTDRGKAAFMGVGHVAPGVTPGQAAANLHALAAGLSQLYPETNQGHSAAVRPLRDLLLYSAGASGASMLYGSAALSIVTAIVLLIACSNVANLLLARSAARQQEMAVRIAMGASRPRLIRQRLTESVLIGLMSGGAGLLLASTGVQFLFGQLPAAANFPTPKLDGNVLVFALAVSLATGFVFGAIPAWKASRANVAETLKEAGRTSGRSRRRVNLTNALVVGQVAFSFLLLLTAALFLRSIARAYAIDPGFETTHLAVFPTNPGQAGYDKAHAKGFYQDVRTRVSSLPGVESVSWASGMPLWSRSVAGL
jgi:predicted permease